MGYGNASFPSQLPATKKPNPTIAKPRVGPGLPALHWCNATEVNGGAVELVHLMVFPRLDLLPGTQCLGEN